MLEQFLIFTRGGLVLWSWKELRNAVLGLVVDSFIQRCLLVEQDSASPLQHVTGEIAYTLDWSLDSHLGLVFLAVSRNSACGELVSKVRDEFCKIYQLKKTLYAEFTEKFDTILGELGLESELAVKNEQQQNDLAEEKSKRTFKSAVKSEANSGDGSGSGSYFLRKHRAKDRFDHSSDKIDRSRLALESENGTGNDDFSKDVESPSRLHNPKPRSHGKHPSSSPLKQHKRAKRLKGNGKFVGSTSEASEKSLASTDGYIHYSDAKKTSSEDNKELSIKFDIEVKKEEEEHEAQYSKSPRTCLPSAFKGIPRNTILERSDLSVPLKALEEDLVAKKLAVTVAKRICEAVAVKLEGKKFGSQMRILLTAQEAMEDTLTHILMPTKRTNITRIIRSHKNQEKPSVIIFPGIDRMQIVTSISQVAYWLLQHNFKIMIASCNIFDSETVEQLHANAKALKAAFYQGGQDKDLASGSLKVIEEAKRKNVDVILIGALDQSNEEESPVSSLLDFFNVLKPDLTLFVGDAAADDQTIRQLLELKYKLEEVFSSSKHATINGIILNNFVSSPEQVASAVSMVHMLGSPIMFVSAEPSVSDLKKFSPGSVVEKLLM